MQTVLEGLMPSKIHSKNTNPVEHTQCATDLDALLPDFQSSTDAPSRNSPRD